MEQPLDMSAPENTPQVGLTNTQPEYQGEGSKKEGVTPLNPDTTGPHENHSQGELTEKGSEAMVAQIEQCRQKSEVRENTSEPIVKRHKPEVEIPSSSQDPAYTPLPYVTHTQIQGSMPPSIPPQLHAQYPQTTIAYPLQDTQNHYQPQDSSVQKQIPSISDQIPPISNQIPSISDQIPPISNQIPPISDQIPPISNHIPPISNQTPPIFDQIPPIIPQLPNLKASIIPPTFTQNAQISSQIPQVQQTLQPQFTPQQNTPSQPSSSNTNDSGIPNPLTAKQLEKLEKQKQREAERISREIQKAEQLRIKKEEREKKELEKKLKREAMEAEKEHKREQERLKKEEKRRKQEEEKAKKEQERKKKEEEKQEREEEKRKEEERKKKEERNQMKISNFFTVKKTPPVQASSVEPTGSPADNNKRSRDMSHYENDFLPFFQKRNVTMPTIQLLQHDSEHKKRAFDEALTAESNTPSSLKSMFQDNYKSQNSISYTTSEELVEALNSSQTSPKQLYQLVQNLPNIKFLQFYENAKPPYVGTWCSEKHLSTDMSVQNPLDKSATGLDYDYDSDLDWQDNDEGEGEDLGEGEDGEEDDDDVEDDEMDDFVDNNDSVKKRGHIGPLQSTCEWNDGNSQTFDDLKYERLDYEIDFPIDPFKNYWNSSPSKITTPTAAKEKRVTSMSQLGTQVKVASEPQVPNVLTPSKPVIKDVKVLESLREFVKNNSDFSLGTLSELAKREFKAYTKSILKHTIQEVASYNKKNNTWEIKPVDALI